MRIYCRSGEDLPHAELLSLSTEVPTADERSLTLTLPGRGRVIITRESDAVRAEATAGVLWILEVSRASEGRDRLREHVKATVQLVTVRGEDPETPGAGTLPSAVEATIARALEGVIEAPEPGRSDRFFDATLKRFYRL